MQSLTSSRWCQHDDVPSGFASQANQTSHITWLDLCILLTLSMITNIMINVWKICKMDLGVYGSCHFLVLYLRRCCSSLLFLLIPFICSNVLCDYFVHCFYLICSLFVLVVVFQLDTEHVFRGCLWYFVEPTISYGDLVWCLMNFSYCLEQLQLLGWKLTHWSDVLKFQIVSTLHHSLLTLDG